MTEIRYRVRQRGERRSKNKISLFIILVGRRSIRRYIILDGGVELCERTSMRLRIPDASTFAFGFTRRVEGRRHFQHDDPRRLSARREVFDGNSNRWHTTRNWRTAKLLANCPNVPVNPIRKSFFARFANSVFQSARAKI